VASAEYRPNAEYYLESICLENCLPERCLLPWHVQWTWENDYIVYFYDLNMCHYNKFWERAHKFRGHFCTCQLGMWTDVFTTFQFTCRLSSPCLTL